VPIAAREILPPRRGVKLAIFAKNGLWLSALTRVWHTAGRRRPLSEAALALPGNAPKVRTAPPQESK